MTATVTAVVETRWLADPSVAMVALGLGLAASVVGWLGRPRGGAAVAGRARWAGLAARIGMLAWLAAAVSGVSWRANQSTAACSAGVLDISLTLPPVAWPGDSVTIEAGITATGIDPGGLRVEATIERVTIEGATIEGEGVAAVQRLPLVIAAASARLQSSPDRSGAAAPTAALTRHRGRAVLDRPGRYRVHARAAVSTADRPGGSVACSGLIDVIERPVSVLVIDSRPRFETRFLDQCLLRDGRLDHSLHLQPSGSSDGGLDASLPAKPLPTTREEWNRHDCIVLGAIDPTRDSAESWTTLAEAAAQDGLGVIWTLDGRCDLEAIHASSLRRLAPVTGLPRPHDRAARQPFRLAAPDALSPRAPWWLDGNPEEAADGGGLWAFGPVYDVFQPGSVRPTARIAARFQGGDQPPAILEDRLGRGRILAFLSETWRWRGSLAGADAAAAAVGNAERYDRLWRGAILTVAAPHLVPPDTTGGETADMRPGERSPSASGTGPMGRSPEQGGEPAAAPGRPDRPAWPPVLATAVLLVVASTEWWLRARGGMA